VRILLVAVLLLTLAAPAHAATVRLTQDYGWCRDFCGKIGGQPDTVVVYDAAPGEANRLTVGRAGRALTLSDPGAAISALAPCVALDLHTASCDSDNFGDLAADWASVRLGDGDDSASVTAGAAVLSGGPGRDTLLGGAGEDRIDGGPGADRIDGGASAWDSLSFRGRRAGVTVDLARGRTSDGDTVANIATVIGGHGADRLFGGPRDDGLLGGGGDDELRGRAGKDTLFGGPGADRLSGGRGADRLAGGRGRDVLDCPSRHDVARRDAKDRVQPCETRRSRGYTQPR
jgi:Ca2+-binding RTX toxin-like protein